MPAKTQTRNPATAIIRLTIAILAATALAVAALACEGGGYDESVTYRGYPGDPEVVQSQALSAREVVSTVTVSREVVVEAEKSLEVSAGMMMDDGDDAAYEIEIERAVEVSIPTAEPVAASAEFAFEDEEAYGEYDIQDAADEFGENVQVAVQPQARIIVRNAEMVVEADDPAQTIADIGDLATMRGGWIVSSNSNDGGFHYITVRVPAETLDAVIDQITRRVSEVQSLNSTSTDFTEEYIDLRARRTTVQQTVDALTALLTSAEYDTVQELLEVQREITNWQSELERIDGRMAFISESAAFSLLSVTVNRAPVPMRVDVGDDVNAGIDVARQFTARFFPPDDSYDRYEITWDFGDGSGTRTVRTALRTQGDDGLLSAPVLHSFSDDDYSPYVVEVKVRAYSDTGLAEGEDRLWATVSELPRIEPYVSADTYWVLEDETIEFVATFNHPDGLRNVEYEWDFRDGSPLVSGAVAAGETGVETTHAFERFRPETYQVRFEIWGDSDAGEVRESSSAWIQVNEAPEIESATFDPGGTATNATNVLIAAISFLSNAAIWIGITSPIWIIIGAIAFVAIRFLRRRTSGIRRVVITPGARSSADAPKPPPSAPTAPDAS